MRRGERSSRAKGQIRRRFRISSNISPAPTNRIAQARNRPVLDQGSPIASNSEQIGPVTVSKMPKLLSQRMRQGLECLEILVKATKARPLSSPLKVGTEAA